MGSQLKSGTRMSRRDFLKQFRQAAILSGLVSTGVGAAAYARILGANDRVTMGLIGC